MNVIRHVIHIIQTIILTPVITYTAKCCEFKRKIIQRVSVGNVIVVSEMTGYGTAFVALASFHSVS